MVSEDIPSPDPAASSADDRPLPAVEAPTGAFIMQLFLIPLVIVAIIVSTWLLIGWLAHADADPRRLAEEIRRQRNGSWQQAYTLSNMLRSGKYKSLRTDSELCGSLINTLEGSLAQKTNTEQAVKLRVFLCLALSRFELEDPIPILVRVAQRKTGQDVEVRFAAVQALAVFADSLGAKLVQFRPDVVDTLIAITEETSSGESRHEMGELQASAVFALGVTGGSKSLDRLSELLNAAYANIRFNAATGLAWHGDPHAAPVLLEMLDPDNSGLMEGELNNSKSPNSLTRQSVLESRQVLVIGSAIRAVNRLSRSGAEFDRETFKQTLTKITKSKLPKTVRTRATEALILLGKTAVKPAA